MAHLEQKVFCNSVVNKYPNYFKNKNVLDVGSLDINGNNRYMFTDCNYIGIDLGEGRNVDVVCEGQHYDAPDSSFDTIVSTECFEHDMYYDKTIYNIIRILKSDGMFIFTCATTGRKEHGTKRSNSCDAPLLKDDWADYYKNLTESDILEILDVKYIFKEYEFSVNENSKDLYFWGIKK